MNMTAILNQQTTIIALTIPLATALITTHYIVLLLSIKMWWAKSSGGSVCLPLFCVTLLCLLVHLLGSVFFFLRCIVFYNRWRLFSASTLDMYLKHEQITNVFILKTVLFEIMKKLFLVDFSTGFYSRYFFDTNISGINQSMSLNIWKFEPSDWPRSLKSHNG